MLHITFDFIEWYILTGYRMLGIVNLDQLTGARHTHISHHNKISMGWIGVLVGQREVLSTPALL